MAANDFARTEIFDINKPVNIDLSDYDRPVPNRGITVFAYGYAALAAIAIACIVLRSWIPVFAKYVVLLEVMAAILLFLSGKCYFSYAKQANRFLRWDLAVGRILEIKETKEGHSFVTMEFSTDGTRANMVKFTEEFNYPLISEIKEIGANGLPVLFQPARAAYGAYYVDIRFKNGKLSKENLRIKNR